MLRGVIVFFLLAALLCSGLPAPAWATVEWSHQQLLKTGDLNPVLNRLDDDLKSEQITTEVFAIIQTIR